MSRFAPSGTMGMISLANRLKAEGKEIFSLVGGEPSFNTAEDVKAAGIKAIEEDFLRYTPGEGIPELRKAIAAKFKESGLDYKPSDIMIAPGTKPLLVAAMMALADLGDEVIIPVPYWVSYPEMARIAGCEPVFVDCDPKTGFRLSPEALEAVITPRTKVLLLNSPNNPTGAIYSEDDLRALITVLKKHPQIWVLTDEIYEHIVYDGRRLVSIAALDPEIAERTVTCNGLSKGYAMAGWRMGFAGGPSNAMKAIGDLIGHLTGASNSISQRAALEALTGDQSYIAEQVASYCERRDMVAAAINQMPGLSCPVPEGAFYLYVDCSGTIGKKLPNGAVIQSDTDFIMGAIEHAGVVMVPGSTFGMGPYFRMSFSMDKALLERAMEKLRRYCNMLS
ncbi:pyridoxal phosphate-dependent aminotransferase [Acetobacteraceae bacterium H6797]|nr:pyridoxal phosphate-dependent aminotransferase [Acetobacteraceae bacterium H6797]